MENGHEDPGPRDRRDDLESVETISRGRAEILHEIRKVIVGQDDVIDQLLIALFARGHCLLVGVPGLAKTLLINTLARALDVRFGRIQFTPDLMPSDITGTDILQEDPESGRRKFQFVRGPVFTNILLADEINRTPPKTQAALLQAMQEYEVTASGQTYSLDPPFFVLATQNPIEQEGTYPLPEAQLDRFMFNIHIRYPSFDEETQIVSRTTGTDTPTVEPVEVSRELIGLQEVVRRVPAAEYVIRYAVNLVQRSRPDHEDAPDFVREYVGWGAGPRASQYLILGAKSRAILNGRFNASEEDIRALAGAVLRHRILTNFNAEADRVTSDDIIERLLASVEPEAALKGSPSGA
ncbi:MAG: MoxR family ATPase [Nitrospinota bacterium]|jgi:MoxR-like ATPase|nr:MoxR family ATPase [Nitrospinota bacterium]MDP6619100.1 MoxR family ATPase [Nitrospinota bacterium]MDP7386153.1 MoxR family ATPase [Nitrospinota bacterium]HJM42966.1 MoxR family ATPase [Nitrospinota bacterium]